jgi:ascorbate-specific PTS system EIIC-type component UlaA
MFISVTLLLEQAGFTILLFLAIPLFFTTAQVIRGAGLYALTSGGRFAAWSMTLI